MLTNFRESLNEEVLENKILIIILILLPIFFLIGNLFINFSIFSFSLLYIFKNIKEKNLDLLKNKIFYLQLLLFLSFVINLCFSNNPDLGYLRVLKSFFLIFFVLGFIEIISLKSFKFEKYIFGTWSAILTLIIIDLLIEFFLGKNMIGLTSYMPGRLTSFFGDELVVGSFYCAFILILLSFIKKNIPNKNLVFLIGLFLIIISFLIGERANFIRTLLILMIFNYLISEVNFKIKFLSILIVILGILGFMSQSEFYKMRYYDQISELFKKGGTTNYLKSSIYGAHYDTAIKIYKNYPFFGVGIKNFRIESSKEKYKNLEFKRTRGRSSTHPHQIHFEFLSETGSIGYLCFLIFIFVSLYLAFKCFLKHKSIYQFSGMLFIVISLLPLLPSGSFFTTFSSGLFWINYSIMMSYLKKENSSKS